MATNYEHYYSTPEKIASIGCNGDCYMCIFAMTIPCMGEFSTTKEIILDWLNSEYDPDEPPHKGKFSL